MMNSEIQSLDEENINEQCFSVNSRSDTFLEDIPLTDKTYNALNKAGIETLAEISKLFHSGKLGQIKGIGRKEEKEIEKVLGARPKEAIFSKETVFDENTPEYDRRKDLFIDWLDDNQLGDELPNLIYVIENLEEYVSNFRILQKPIFNEYSPYVFEDLLDTIQGESDSEDIFEEMNGETLLFISYYIDFLYEEDAGVHYKRRKKFNKEQ